MGWTVLYIAFGMVALWLLGEVLLQYKARLRWRMLAFFGFLGVVFGVLLPSVPVITLGALAFATGQTLVTLSYRKGFSTGWALGGNPGNSARRREVRPMDPLPDGSGGAGADHSRADDLDDGYPPRTEGRRAPAAVGAGRGGRNRETADTTVIPGVLGGWGETPAEPHQDPLVRPYGQDDNHGYADWSDPGAGAAGATGSDTTSDTDTGWDGYGGPATADPSAGSRSSEWGHAGYGGTDWAGTGAPDPAPASYGVDDPYETGGWSTVGYGGIADTGAQPVAGWGVGPDPATTPGHGWGTGPTPPTGGQGMDDTFVGGYPGVSDTGSQGYGYPAPEPGYPWAQAVPPSGGAPRAPEGQQYTETPPGGVWMPQQREGEVPQGFPGPAGGRPEEQRGW
ncbi:hypothetical protein [Streptomyces sp. ST2-7A]|uniref:hypothetical protein n=1 Tax=Streptomyces sp. ST2-7A TaxID=2907214 RepID=UPI001F193361|nr:hypothetical protein [Streptomyces sp. ST2-7A]MCE7083145.1 hypothetical protein [Streptomyces sp. ST2-7A]